MEIVRLAPGEEAPVDTDCIKISPSDDGSFELVTSALEQCDDDDGEAVSEAVVGGASYPTYEAAETAGLEWARERCADVVYVETGDE